MLKEKKLKLLYISISAEGSLLPRNFERVYKEKPLTQKDEVVHIWTSRNVKNKHLCDVAST
jgi:hypothetical protein